MHYVHVKYFQVMTVMDFFNSHRMQLVYFANVKANIKYYNANGKAFNLIASCLINVV